MEINDKMQRDTKQRQLVRDEVTRRMDHPCAEDVYEAVHARNSRVSKGTVYRNLGVLAASREIALVEIPGANRYDSRLDDHPHIFCTSCGMVADAPLGYSSESDRHVADRTGFSITRHRTIFEGVCPQCQSRGEASRGSSPPVC